MKMTESEMTNLKLEIIQFILDCNDEAVLSKVKKILQEEA